MTRMGFGLNVAPKIMSKVLSKVLSLDCVIAKGTDNYIDDIWVNTSIVDVAVVRKHLEKFGLVTKEPVDIADARVLGLRVSDSGSGVYMWHRDTAVPVAAEPMTKRELHSVCGKLLGHYPVAGWLRVACSFIKRVANDCKWDQTISDEVAKMLQEIMKRVHDADPVVGNWLVDSQGGCRVWCDASSLAVGTSIEIGGTVVEDATWLRKTDDAMHINVSELEAVVKGINLAIKWNMSDMEVMTDSVTVYNWVNSIIKDSHRAKVSGLSEMIVRRRLGVIAELIKDYALNITITLVKSAANKADALTRVPQRWLKHRETTVVAASCVKEHPNEVEDLSAEIRQIHEVHHLGVKRTMYLVKTRFGDKAPKELVDKVVRECMVCKRIDPAPVTWETGSLSVEEIWYRLAVDITHVNSLPYLTIVDCGPSRYAIWCQLKDETTNSVSVQLSKLFNERGPPQELLSDNGPCFRSEQFAAFLEKWSVHQIFSCAYRPTGNGIVERNYRTIKRMVARSRRGVGKMVFWYK